MTWTDLPPAAVALTVGAVLLLAAGLTRRLWLRRLGPVFAYETVRLARQGRVVVLRCLYALAVLAALYAVFPAEREVPRADVGRFSQRFAEEFSHAYLVIQAVALTLLTPIYVAGAVSDEKEKRSLDFLLAAPLSSFEIVGGKLAARLVNLFGGLLAGLPILALTQLWGGVDLLTILSGTAATAFQVLSLGAFAILCSVGARRTVHAVVIAYAVPLLVMLLGAAAPGGFVSSPIALQMHQ